MQLSQRFRDNTTGLAEIAKTIAVPHEHKPLRLPTYPNLERTAVLQFMYNGTLGLINNSQPVRFALCRSPVYPAWGTTQVNIASTNSVDIIAPSFFNISPNGSYQFSDIFEEWLSYGSATYCGRPWPVGLCNNKTHVYAPPGHIGAVELSFNALSVTTQFTLEWEIYGVDGPRMKTNVFVANAGATALFCPLNSSNSVLGFWRPHRLSIAAAGAVVNVSVRIGVCTGGNFTTPTLGATSIFAPLSGPPEFGTTSLPYEDSRCGASSLLLSNVTKVLNKEGTVQAVRFAARAANATMFDFTEATMDNVHPTEKYFGPLEKGVYCFSLPDSDSEVFSSGIFFAETLLRRHPVFDLDRLSYWTGIILTDPAPDDQTTMAYTVDWHVEFRSQSVLFPRGYSTYSLETYHASQLALAKMGTIYENPLHLSSIAAAARAAAHAVWPYVKPVVAAGVRMAGQKMITAGRAMQVTMPQDGLVRRDRSGSRGRTRKPRPKKVVVRRPKRK